MSLWLLLAVVLIATAAAQGKPVPGAPSCPMTPADSFWHADVVRPARSRAVGGVDLQHRRDGGTQGRLRLRHVGRRADRHPVHDRARQRRRGCRCPSTTRTRATPARTRSRRTRRSRAARAPPATATCWSSIVTPAGCGSSTARIRSRAARRGQPGPARRGISTRTRCVRSAGRPATLPACRSCPGSSATTRSPRARSTT